MKATMFARIMLGSSIALGLAACESSGSYRVGSVGSSSPDDPGSGNGPGSGSGSGGGGGQGSVPGGGTGSGSSGQPGLVGGLLVTAGNAVIGVAGKQAELASKLPAAGVVSGRVAGVLNRTGQTLVRLGNGQGVVLNGSGGVLGDLVSLDLGKGKVIRADKSSAPLIGLNVLAANPTTGRLTTINAVTQGQLVGVNVPATSSGASGIVAGAVNTVGTTVNTVTGGSSAGSNGLVGNVQGTVKNTVGNVLTPVGAAAGAAVSTKPAKAALGLNALLVPKQ